MNATTQNLNLARKWRPKTFDQIVGQDISVRILKNSIYLKKLFPVYLFAGQRGCGKTSTARIFGAAINCQNLEKFQQNPAENKIPCLECVSCKAMQQGNHPDFIEIDAASHTGVENVRQILESCAYMPIFGSKKIYLIDEAHMLSKAAFNAFLKILEEPPASALFILATTEIQKFPETVLSRCFQVIFKSIEHDNLKEHIKKICQKEEIKISDPAIDLIIQETDGSARDAINLLERVRFCQDEVSVNSLLHVLGKISETELFSLFETLLDQNPSTLLNQLSSENMQNLNPANLWNMIVQLCRTLLWVKFGAVKLPTTFSDLQRLKTVANKCSLNRLNAIMQLLWTQEELFLRTPQKHIFLETVLLQLCQQVNIADLDEIIKTCKAQTPTYQNPQPTFQKEPIITQSYPQIPTPPIKQNTENPEPIKSESEPNKDNKWQCFLEKINQLNDPMLSSILGQTQFISTDEEKKVINVSLNNHNQFFIDKINESKNGWMPHFLEFFPNFVGFNFIVNQNPTPQPQPQPKNQPQIPPQRSVDYSPKPHVQTFKPNTFPQKSFPQRAPFAKKPIAEYLNISDALKWPKANLLTKLFPGRIKIQQNKQ